MAYDISIENRNAIVEEVQTEKEVLLLFNQFQKVAKIGDFAVTYDDQTVEIWSADQIAPYLPK